MPPECPTSGIFQRDQAHILKNAGYKVGVISPNLKSIRFIPKKAAWRRFGYHFDGSDGIPVYGFDGWNWSVRLHGVIGWRWNRRGMRLFRKYIKSHGRPDIIHGHNALYAGMLAHRLKYEFHIPYVLTEHSSAYAEGFYPARFHRAVNEIYRNADRLMVVSPKLGDLLASMFPDGTKSWQWIPNVLDTRFEDLPIRAHVSDDGSGVFTILSIGNLDENKNHESLIKAFSDRFRGRIGIRLKIGGEGPLFNRLNRMARERHVEDQISFLGYIDREQVLEEMDSSDLVVLPSRYETFGVVLIEALARGKPVVATACGGPECIVDSVNGMLVPIDDSVALGDAMEEMVNTIDRYDANTIRTNALALFGKKAIADKLSNIYHEAIQNSNTSS